MRCLSIKDNSKRKGYNLSRVAIGILAYNEENDIGTVIKDIANQTCLQDPGHVIELHIVANGCTDRTVTVSQRELNSAEFQRPTIRTLVHDLPLPGKSNAWNELVHKLCSANTDFLILLDADIRIPESSTLERLIQALTNSREAVVAVDESVKDLSLSTSLTIIERLI